MPCTFSAAPPPTPAPTPPRPAPLPPVIGSQPGDSRSPSPDPNRLQVIPPDGDASVTGANKTGTTTGNLVGTTSNTNGTAGNTTVTPAGGGSSSSFNWQKLLQIGVPIVVGLSAVVTLSYTLYKWYHKKQQQPAVGIPLAGSSTAMYGVKGLSAVGPTKPLQVVTVDGQDSLAPLHPGQASMLAPQGTDAAGLQQQYYRNALQQQAQPQLYSPHAASRI